jgi:hypothetical protein
MNTSLTRSTPLCMPHETDPATETPGQRAIRFERDALPYKGSCIPGRCA